MFFPYLLAFFGICIGTVIIATGFDDLPISTHFLFKFLGISIFVLSITLVKVRRKRLRRKRLRCQSASHQIVHQNKTDIPTMAPAYIHCFPLILRFLSISKKISGKKTMMISRIKIR